MYYIYMSLYLYIYLSIHVSYVAIHVSLYEQHVRCRQHVRSVANMFALRQHVREWCHGVHGPMIRSSRLDQSGC